MFYQVMDGDICIQDRRSEADRRIRTNTHRVGPILFGNNLKTFDGFSQTKQYFLSEFLFHALGVNLHPFGNVHLNPD